MKIRTSIVLYCIVDIQVTMEDKNHRSNLCYGGFPFLQDKGLFHLLNLIYWKCQRQQISHVALCGNQEKNNNGNGFFTLNGTSDQTSASQSDVRCPVMNV